VLLLGDGLKLTKVAYVFVVISFHRIQHLTFYVVCLHVVRWVEEDPVEILQSVKTCIEKAVENLKTLNIDPTCIKGISYMPIDFLH